MSDLAAAADEEPPASARETTGPERSPMRIMPKRSQRAGQEFFHWGFGAVGGAAFAMLPGRVRAQPWAGPIWGLAIWLGFELGAAPVLGLSQAKEPRPVDRVTPAADHLLYGLVLSELRSRARG